MDEIKGRGFSRGSPASNSKTLSMALSAGFRCASFRLHRSTPFPQSSDEGVEKLAPHHRLPTMLRNIRAMIRYPVLEIRGARMGDDTIGNVHICSVQYTYLLPLRLGVLRCSSQMSQVDSNIYRSPKALSRYNERVPDHTRCSLCPRVRKTRNARSQMPDAPSRPTLAAGKEQEGRQPHIRMEPQS